MKWWAIVLTVLLCFVVNIVLTVAWLRFLSETINTEAVHEPSVHRHWRV